jgi:uncharacterized 2Fe-2S/4Fe-4S cluster protein (DUF4445 family)
MFRLTIQLPHEERHVDVPASRARRLLTDVLRGMQLPLNTRCGQRGLCDGCTIELVRGNLQRAATGELLAARAEAQPLRGCEVSLPARGEAVIHVPSRSLLAHQPQVVTSFRLNVPRAHDPLWQSLRIAANELVPTTSLREALRAAVASQLECTLPLVIGPDVDKLVPRDDGAYHLALEHRGDHCVLRDLDVMEPAYGLAVDVGTTTVVVIVVELTTGRIVGSASALNAQTRLGDNVLTRINLCMKTPHIVQRMQRAIVRGTLSPLLAEALREAGIDPRQLACMVVAGNTTMLHLLHGVDPTSMGTAPFTPTFLEHRVVDASQLRLEAKLPNSHAATATDPDAAAAARDAVGRMAVHSLPGAAAYVGADVMAGVLATGMAYRDDTCLLVDLGTNGEIILKHNGVLLGCATAAGPAFEGAGLTYGMRAGHGAIGHVWLEKDPPAARIEVIGGTAAIGLCGTAYIDFVARARQIGLITPTARFVSPDAPGVIRHPSHGWAFVVSRGQGPEPLLITEADMASLLQAKAAIAAGVICLLQRAGVDSAHVTTVYLAGGFGFHMHIDSLLGCGMLPGFRPDQIELVGNSSLAGAYLTLLDSSALREIRQLSHRMEIVELNRAPQFETIYIDQLSLPES